MVEVFKSTVEFLGKSIQRFVFSLFLIFLMGMIYALIVVPLNPWLLFLPVILAGIAYFSRTGAVIVFLAFILFFFIL